MLRAPGASNSTSLLCGNQAAPHHLSVDLGDESVMSVVWIFGSWKRGRFDVLVV